jgi:hypothetical protein
MQQILRYGTDGFSSPPNEIVLEISIALKNLLSSWGLNPQSLSPVASPIPLDHRRRLALDRKYSSLDIEIRKTIVTLKIVKIIVIL